jgi:NADH:ubiquinone oxidoreductase subunit
MPSSSVTKVRPTLKVRNKIEGEMKIGTILNTWLNAELVGTDIFSNRYYCSKRSMLSGRKRRWVIYKGTEEASSIPAEWHSWLHHTTDTPLTESAAQSRSWQKEHEPNLSGTTRAYLPQGHEYLGGRRASATGDYQSWSPEN